MCKPRNKYAQSSRDCRSRFQRVQAGKIMALFLEFLTQQWMLVAALLVVIALLIMHEARKSGPSLSPQQAINLVNAEEGVFVDLRDVAEFRKGHIVSAINIPSAKLPERMVELEKYKDKPIVLVCKMGQQSSAAGKQLKDANYGQVYKMAGGMMEWGNVQLPMVN
jgi:rhodanese-related sulfurtransferase